MTDPLRSARDAGLRYVSDRMPGIRRIGTGKTFRYIGPDGRLIRDPATLQRIRMLVIPPAWTAVWICPVNNGHLQAVGRDSRRRKQYRYHARWREVRDETKYHRMLAFGRVLPKIRARVERDLASPALTREKVLATIIRLLETTHIRVGNEEYSRHNNSFGLTTLRSRHVSISGSKVSFYFRGKSGVRHSISLQDKHLARIVRKLQDLPGYELFQYVDDAGVRHSIGSSDVNDYLRGIAGEDFSTKDFRTWNGTVLAAVALSELPKVTNRSVTKAIECVAQQLGNTPAVCRKCYVHPSVIQSYIDKTLCQRLHSGRTRRYLSSEEDAVLSLLEDSAKQNRPATRSNTRAPLRVSA